MCRSVAHCSSMMLMNANDTGVTFVAYQRDIRGLSLTAIWCHQPVIYEHLFVFTR